jgi:hypothetical protein
LIRALLLASLVLVPLVAGAVPVELRGSAASMQRQNQVAVKAEYSFARTMEDIDRMLEEGELVELKPTQHLEIRSGLMSHATRPEVRVFLTRLAEEYHKATGERLVVTSLTRPSGNQPRNASRLSVHPTGMAVDLRISQKAASRQWIEKRLLGMEKEGLLDVTRESFPPHYHVALFPERYMGHLEAEIGPEATMLALGCLVPDVGDDGVVILGDHEPEEEPEPLLWRHRVLSFIGVLFGRV